MEGQTFWAMIRPAFRAACAFALFALAADCPAAGADRRAAADAAQAGRDPLAAMVRRMDRYLERNEVDGVTMDWRYSVSPSEEIRQTVVCQVLAYVELYRLRPTGRLRRDIVEHADFMLGRLAEIRSYTPFDGMLAYALLETYETTGEARFLAAGRQVTDDMLAIPTSQCVLNGGLMVAMATAQDARMTGNAASAQKTAAILAQLVAYQNADGSFPHWCVGSEDIHYTGWMAMELIHIARQFDDPIIAPMLARMNAFLERRIGPDGRASYDGACPGSECGMAYYSRASGCGYDYDSRGWTVEPAYCTLLFDHEGSPQFEPVFGFLSSLEDGGTFADLYAYWPPPDDPEYPWTIADTSVVNMSVIFWALTTALTDRVERGVPVALVLDDDAALVDVPAPDATPVALRLVVRPNPARGNCRLAFTLPEPAHVAVAVHDAAGRRVRALAEGALPAGDHALAWDGRDDRGAAAPAGVYFATLAVDGAGLARTRFVRL